MTGTYRILTSALLMAASTAWGASDCENKKFERFAFDVIAAHPLARVSDPVGEKEVVAIFGRPINRSASLVTNQGHYSDAPEWDIDLEYPWGNLILSASGPNKPCKSCAVSSVAVTGKGILLSSGIKLGMPYEQVLEMLGNPQQESDGSGLGGYTVCQELKRDGLTYGGYATVQFGVDQTNRLNAIKWSFWGD